MDKYPNKGMNALAKKNPEVAKKIMGYRYGGSVKKYSNGGMACKHRPDGIRGGGCAEGGMKFTGTK